MRYLILWLALTSCLIESQGQATPIEVVFQVDMSNADEVSEVSLVGGSIGGWCTDCNMMTDENGDGIYQITIELLPGGHEYRFANGGTLEVFEPFIGECTTSTPDGAYTNRYLYISGSETNLILPAHCFEQCDLCISPGCTDSNACNYNPESNFDDGSCDYCFCGEGTQWVDSLQACMITEEALMQACGEGTYWDDLAQACLTIETCQEDLDGDGIVGINDLLELLSSFGSECMPEPETAEWTCGDPVNYHGYDYATVQIGEQCWFAENLRTELYQNGDSISSGLDNDLWEQATSGAFAYYGEGSSSCTHWVANFDACDPDQSLTEFGIFYNWYAVDDPRNICPAQWSIPSEFDWNTLIAQAQSIDSINPSSLLKSHSGWHSELGDYGNGINYFGFNGLPSGRRYWLGWFGGAGLFAPWWTSSEAELNSNYARSFQLHTSYATVDYGDYNKNEGRPIRCIKDSE